MRYPLFLIPIVAILAGCADDNNIANRAPSDEQTVAANEWMISSIHDAAVKNAIITQHTLFPYHFQTGRDELNELGQRDLAVLAEYYRTGKGGPLSIRRADADESLYNARLNAVTTFFRTNGVNASRIQIIDANPAGPGIASDQVVRILKIERQEQPYATQVGGRVEVPVISSEGDILK